MMTYPPAMDAVKGWQPGQPLVELSGIHFAYPGRQPVLNGLDWRLEAGGRLGIIGPTGAGKSTLFLLTMGLLRPSAGQIRAFGQPCQEEKDFLPVRARLGLCFQDPDDQLFSPTVLEDVAFGPLNLGRDREQARKLASQTLERLGLAGFEDRVTYQLSGGEKRLVSLATVLAMEPVALLLDEPTSGLDPDTRQRLIQVLNDSDLAWAIISHDHAFLSATCRDFLRLQGGRLEPVQLGQGQCTPEGLVSSV